MFRSLSLALAAFAVVAAAPVSAQESLLVATIEDIQSGVSNCIEAVSPDGVDIGLLERAGWTLSAGASAEELGYERVGSNSRVTLPADDDGVQRICVLSAPVASTAVFDQLADRFTATLRAREIEQTNSRIWMFERKGVRGIQMYEEGTDSAPRVRVIAALFVGRS